jgi:hypothetical protein
MLPRRREGREGNAKRRQFACHFPRALGVFAVIFIFAFSQRAMASEARDLLSKRVPQAKLDNIALTDALDFLRDIAGVNISVDWKALEAAGVSKDAQVNLELHNVSAGKILSLILSQAGPGDLLTWYIDRDVVQITTRAIADQQMITIVYYVMDLLQPNPSFNYQIQGITSGSAQISGGGGGGGGTTLTQSNNSGSQTQNMQTAADNLVKLIETVVRPEVWRDNGGSASIEYWNGNLIVTAPRSVQEAIGGPVD